MLTSFGLIGLWTNGLEVTGVIQQGHIWTVVSKEDNRE